MVMYEAMAVVREVGSGRARWTAIHVCMILLKFRRRQVNLGTWTETRALSRKGVFLILIDTSAG